jgi:hypothetical protein
VAVIRTLHKAGASLEVQNKKKDTPLEVAREFGDESTIRLMEALASGTRHLHANFAYPFVSHEPVDPPRQEW